MTRLLPLIVISLLWLPTLHAWNPTTHRLSSQIAWNELTPDVRQKVIQILQFHPRFDTDFNQEMPIDVRRGSKQERHAWLLQQASIWPDLVRDLSKDNERAKHNRPKWHYVNIPLFLSRAEAESLQKSISPNLDIDPSSAAKPKDMNIFQAIKYNASILRNRHAPYRDRAVALCWIAHLVQDIHQPLHTTTLFTTGRFTAGDRGGNRIPISDRGRRLNLHALWDSMISGNQSHKIIRKRAAFLANMHREIGLETTETMSVRAWAKENQTVARMDVYPLSITGEIEQKERMHEALPPIKITEKYRIRGQEVAEIRIVEASFRLAYLLNQL